MSAGVSVAVADAMLTGATGTGDLDYVALATGDPGSAGTTSPSSVTTRESVTWGTPASAAVSATNQPEWTAWAGTNGEVETYITFWSAAISGTFGASMQLTSSVTMDTGDSLTLTSLQVSIPTAS